MVVAAETGSGKTLAYLMPLIQQLKQQEVLVLNLFESCSVIGPPCGGRGGLFRRESTCQSFRFHRGQRRQSVPRHPTSVRRKRAMTRSRPHTCDRVQPPLILLLPRSRSTW